MDSSPTQPSSSSAPSSSPPPSQSPVPPSPTSSVSTVKQHRGREYNLYDAVAGRITLNDPLRLPPPSFSSTTTSPNFTTTTNTTTNTTNTTSSQQEQRQQQRQGRRRSSFSAPPRAGAPRLAPEEVLFRRRKAPTRYAESDIYWANEDLDDGGGGGGSAALPGSGLLVSVHRYASLFYEHVGLKGGDDGGGSSSGVWVGRDGQGAEEEGGGSVGGLSRGDKKRLVDERSMEESALLAFGILLEEAGREVLGRGGEKVFVEGSGRSGEDGERGGGGGGAGGWWMEGDGTEVIIEGEAGRLKERERGVKRRKVGEV
ncbi:hypothetical protein QBC42DRAFT_324240 [Cladorrhinum samala]|uniref:Uncharacterized protein n=1 Tax=Cladorrhinum samala TaxID=585594 RepID=A0AAV9HUU6_9PEZI|nr:hypothetical protein QBC42DRAFT_324240 [Cladorrhinum samala]